MRGRHPDSAGGNLCVPRPPSAGRKTFFPSPMKRRRDWAVLERFLLAGRKMWQLDMFCLGKALSGGFYPVSAVVLSRGDFERILEPGSQAEAPMAGIPWLARWLAKPCASFRDEVLLYRKCARAGRSPLKELRTIKTPSSAKPADAAF